MRKNTVIIGASAAIVLAVAGVGTAAAVTGGFAPTATPTATTSTTSSTATADTSSPAPTGPGDVCDPHNLNDLICAAFYPNQAVINMTSRATGPLASKSAAEKISLAHDACATLEAGGTAATTQLITPASDNTNLFVTATLAYCNDKIDDSAGTDFQWVVKTYKAMGEQAAKDSFAGGVVIHR